jgi:NAD(P)-dependent dehydrogenase (short-subunit alcohol dehydrogenase family)
MPGKRCRSESHRWTFFDTSQDLVAIVSDASRGIGRAIVIGLAAVGADIALCGRWPAKLDAVANLMRSQGHREPV